MSKIVKVILPLVRHGYHLQEGDEASFEVIGGWSFMGVQRIEVFDRREEVITIRLYVPLEDKQIYSDIFYRGPYYIEEEHHEVVKGGDRSDPEPSSLSTKPLVGSEADKGGEAVICEFCRRRFMARVGRPVDICPHCRRWTKVSTRTYPIGCPWCDKALDEEYVAGWFATGEDSIGQCTSCGKTITLSYTDRIIARRFE